MPAKFKESERVYRKDARGRRMSTDSQKCKVYKHYYLKQTPKKDLAGEAHCWSAERL